MSHSKIAFKITEPSRTASKPQKKKFKTAQEQIFPSLKSFELLREIFEDEAGEAFKKFFKWYQKTEPFDEAQGQKGADSERGSRLYRRLWKALLESGELLKRPSVGNALQDHLLERFLDNPNIFHRKAERAPYHQIGLSLKNVYEEELDLFLVLLRADWESLLKKKVPKGSSLPTLAGMKPVEVTRAPTHPVLTRLEMKEKILKESRKASDLLPEICAHFFENGFGLFGHYRAFRWDAKQKALEGVEFPDPIRLEDLVGYDEARAPLLDNIKAFAQGKPANNVLIYGERGTGKSSTVKALLNTYQKQGLRLVEVSSADLKDYPVILLPLRGRQEKFILFVDDLSFEENETQYKGLKALLEGTVEATPPNVILIATSNRRHLVREFFTEREEGVHLEAEVHGQDTVEEKLSLSDRFGLVISFYTPNQETYLKIVDQWAKTMGVRLPAEELHAQAIFWARQNNSPSGRTARQFINDLKGRA
jgi:predicted AAA+ superfamily ATPase